METQEISRLADLILKRKQNNFNTHCNPKKMCDILRLLEFVLSNSFFIYNDKTYKQIHGCAMGSPVSAIVANLCMEVIEEQAIQSATTRPKTWKRFVDDSFAIINKNAITSFHDTLNLPQTNSKYLVNIALGTI